jgi:hypothetical protein
MHQHQIGICYEEELDSTLSETGGWAPQCLTLFVPHVESTYGDRR